MTIALSSAAIVQPATRAGAISLESSVKPKSAELARLTKAAGEFESMLLQTLWKSMKNTFSDSDSDDKDSDPTSENFGDLGMQSLSGAVGNAGALGFKGLILKHLEPTIAGAGGAGQGAQAGQGVQGSRGASGASGGNDATART